MMPRTAGAAASSSTNRRIASFIRPTYIAEWQSSRRLSRRHVRELPDLREPEAVARRVAEAGVDAVGPLLGLLGELDAAALEQLDVGVDVVGGQEDRSGEALAHEV